MLLTKVELWNLFQFLYEVHYECVDCQGGKIEKFVCCFCCRIMHHLHHKVIERKDNKSSFFCNCGEWAHKLNRQHQTQSEENNEGNNKLKKIAGAIFGITGVVLFLGVKFIGKMK